MTMSSGCGKWTLNSESVEGAIREFYQTDMETHLSTPLLDSRTKAPSHPRYQRLTGSHTLNDLPAAMDGR